MSYIPKFTPKELSTILEAMREFPPDKVELAYRNREITLKEKMVRLQLYGQAQREAQISSTVAEAQAKEGEIKSLGAHGMGELKYFFQGVAKEYKSAWDNAQEGKPAEAVFYGMMGSLKLLGGFDVPGDVVERWSLEMFPDSPGFARAANWAVWTPMNLFGISTVLKAPFRAALGTAKAGVKAGHAVGDFAAYLKDPVGWAVKSAKSQDALLATKLARSEAENVTRKSAGVAGAAIEAEKKGGTQVFKTAEPPVTSGPGVIPAPAFASPQDLEKLTVTELIKHYEQRAIGMIRSSTYDKPIKSGVSHAETKASATPFSIEEIAARAPDAPISATELESIGMVHEQVSKAFNAVLDDASKYIDDIAAGNRSDLVQAYKAHLAAMVITNPAFLSARGQTGRGLEYMKTMQDLVGESKIFDTLTRALGSEKLLEGSNEAIAYTMRKVFELGKMERAKLTELAASEAYKTPTLRLIYKSLLFARPGIHAANILGNINSIMLHGVNKSVSAVMPWSETTWREASAYWTGMWEAKNKWGELWQRAIERQSSALSKAGIEGTATGTLVSKGPLGWLGFEDELMTGVLEQGLAKSRAITEGLAKWDELQNAVKAGASTLPAGTNKKKWLADFVDSAMTDPMNYERLVKQTEKEADYIIFRSPLSHGGELAAKSIRESVFDYLAPVVKFPINAMKMARDWTPGLQMLSKDFMEAVAEGGARADAARARMTLSWMISSQVYEGAKAGIITGDGPLNPQSNAIWQAAGNTRRTIHGVPIQWAEPFGTWFAFIADLAHNGAEMDEENLSNAFQAVMTSGLQAIENNYFLRIAEGVTNSISDFKRVTDLNDILGGVGKLIAQPVKTLVTGGTVGRVVGETINPERPDMKIYGELKDLKNWFFASTPFGADTRPRLNYSGKVEMVPPMLGAQWIKDNLGAPDWFARGVTALFEPSMRTNIGEDDPVAQFLAKHELTLHDNWKYYGTGANPGSPLPSRIDENNPRVNLTGDQAFTWKHLALNKAKEYGTDRTWVQAIQALDADPDFINAPLYEKQQEVNRLYGTFRADALEALKTSDPTLAAKEAQALITPKVNVQTSNPMMEAVQ